jgi:hypothetical protein
MRGWPEVEGVIVGTKERKLRKALALQTPLPCTPPVRGIRKPICFQEKDSVREA